MAKKDGVIEIEGTIIEALPRDKDQKILFGDTHTDTGDKGPGVKDPAEGTDLSDDERFAVASEFFSGKRN